jgi:hypothetical protein
MSLKARLRAVASPVTVPALDPETAERLALQRLLGECQLALRRGEHPRVIGEMLAAFLTAAQTQDPDVRSDPSAPAAD